MRKLLGFALVVSTCALFRPTPAEACGGCFVPQSERTVVTDHRMALSISQQQTVLWDQIRYSGDPAEFAWVLPVRAGAKATVMQSLKQAKGSNRAHRRPYASRARL